MFERKAEIFRRKSKHAQPEEQGTFRHVTRPSELIDNASACETPRVTGDGGGRPKVTCKVQIQLRQGAVYVYLYNI